MLEEASKEYLWTKPSDSRGRDTPSQPWGRGEAWEESRDGVK